MDYCNTVLAFAPTAWNSLPHVIRDPTSSTDCFRRLLKTYSVLVRALLVHPAHECFSAIMRYTNPRTHSLTRNRSTKCRQSTSRLRLGDDLKVGEDIWVSAAPTPRFGSRLSVHAVSHLQTWNWVTFCDPMMTRESSDPETQLTR